MKFVTLVALALLFEQTPPRFRVEVDAVRVDALATDGNRALRGLTAADFELRDNGVPQRIDSVVSDAAAINAIMLKLARY